MPEERLNHLAHLHLAALHPRGKSAAAIAGGLAADFVRGVELSSLSPDLRAGIEQHREIDLFTDRHPVFRQSRGRLPSELRHWRSVLVDIYYDHFLARQWPAFDPRPFAAFTAESYAIIEDAHRELPPRLRELAPRMIEHDWLAGYASDAGLERVFKGMARRTQRANPFAEACDILRTHRAELEIDFACFYPQLKDFVAHRTASVGPVE